MTAEVGDLSPQWREARWGWWVAGTVVRVVLLLILLFGALLVVAAASPTTRTLADFRTALKAGRVSVVVYRAPGPETVSPDGTPPPVSGTPPGRLYALKWAEGPLVWHRIVQEPASGGADAYTLDRLHADASPMGTRVTWEGNRQSTWWYATWPFEIPQLFGMWWVGVAWVATFVIMVSSTPRLGNRWAWFWLFGAGQIGAIAFLLLEPRPLWHRYGRRPPQRGRIRGGTGCLLSIATAALAVGAAFTLGNLLNAVLP
ncbi:hypothetical protein ACFQ08_12710 [Streptosporangium algeriense]|uniref:DUF3592 domain-containing protein n=1 Tax=Streptosporangium algeriense TaxID=1682748 RepID=A0ABW3DRJ3_9ACTN